MRSMIVLLGMAMGLQAGRAADRAPGAAGPIQPVVEAEEDVYSCTPANNGAGPMWCSGSTCLARVGQDVFASGLETLTDAKPLNNCRWTLYKRGANGWELQQADKAGRTREPCPLAALAGGKLLLSVNPTLVPDQRAGPARPEILQFSAADPKAPFETILPAWDGTLQFTEHSYRSFAADGAAGTLILLQNIGYTHAEWAFRDQDGRWTARGKLPWPMGAEYDKPGPIRVCYPNVALKGRAVHFCGVSDIVEPYQKWREYKRRVTGQEWDYDFRRLFYTWSPDITAAKFGPWVEIASRDKTAGWISPGDLWLGNDGAVHVLWTERALDERMRKEFFPGEKQSHALNYAVLRDGKVAARRTLVLAEEGGANEVPGRGRFHVTPEGRLFVFYYVSGTDAGGKNVSENRLTELLPDGSSGPHVRVPLKRPFSECFTTTVRSGSPPSSTLEILGQRAGAPQAISYARIRLQ
ncbi:MAG: hypothetical protein NTW87_23535 [Planctomycetota bacterium]|nr:hypothetical protein [Planctomycetota bacterium]